MIRYEMHDGVIAVLVEIFVYLKFEAGRLTPPYPGNPTYITPQRPRFIYGESQAP
jgi:hypothetical protein